MPQVSVFKVNSGGNGESALFCEQLGEFPIGRGALLQCSDKRVSRKHAIIKIRDNSAVMVSVHVNPLFFISSVGQNMVILPKHKEVELADLDRFAFLTDGDWYRIRVDHTNVKNDSFVRSEVMPIKENESEVRLDNMSKESDDTSSKCEVVSTENDICVKNEVMTSQDGCFDENAVRNDSFNIENDSCVKSKVMSNEEYKSEVCLPDMLNDSSPKIEVMPSENDICVRNEVMTPQDSCFDENVNKNNRFNIENGSCAKSDVTTTEENKSEVMLTGNVKNEVVLAKNGETGEVTSANVDNCSIPSSSADLRKKRDCCWYGAQCFRTSAVHKLEFSHPGDADYLLSDVADNRPMCPYGIECYRRNRQHRTDFKHCQLPNANINVNLINANNDSVANTTNNNKRRKRQNRGTIDDDDDGDDEYDMEDPFMANSDSEDEDYVLSSDGDDSDFNIDENNDNSNGGCDVSERKRLVKEAKRFITNKRKK